MTVNLSPERIVPVGPIPAKIMLVGEAPGADEERLGLPFVGQSGQELTRMLADAGIERNDCFLTNVFLTRPTNNELRHFCTDVRSASLAYPSYLDELRSCWPERPWPETYSFPAISQGLHIHPKYLFELARLVREIRTVKPTIVVALGNTAVWALLGFSGVTKIRGSVAMSSYGVKVLPTFHPAYILRSWTSRIICVADFIKARNETTFPELRLPKRRLLVSPRLDEVFSFYETYLKTARRLSFDIETKHGMIEMISFSPNPNLGLVIPFLDQSQPNFSYWTHKEEFQILKLIQTIFDSPAEKVAQNGLYDIQWIRRKWRMKIRNYAGDSMLLSHSMHPELPKDLGFLGSVHTNEQPWKLLRSRGKDEIMKRED